MLSWIGALAACPEKRMEPCEGRDLEWKAVPERSYDRLANRFLKGGRQMKILRNLVVPIILLLGVIGFLAVITELPVVYTAGGKYCNEGSQLFCWTSLPDWYCLTATGGTKCVNPDN